MYFQIIADIVNHLLDKKNDVAWNATRPVGTEGSALLQTMNQFSAVVSKSLEYHVKDEILVNKEAVIKVVRPTLGENLIFQRLPHSWMSYTWLHISHSDSSHSLSWKLVLWLVLSVTKGDVPMLK